MRGPRIVVLGGGSGIPVVLRGLARLCDRGPGLEVTAIVATADDGGSSGRLRRDLGGLSLGDLRRCLLALAPERDPLPELLSHRFEGNGPLAGHAFGNLFLAALAEREGCPVRAVELAGAMLGCRGRVLPSTRGAVTLRAETEDGRRVDGESAIGRGGYAIRRVALEPAGAEAPDAAVRAVEDADVLVVGPGSLFTSLLSVLCVEGIAAAARRSRARRVLVANLMTQPGETTGLRLSAHLAAFDRHVGSGFFDDVLAHDGAFEPWRIAPYAAEGAEPVYEPLPSERPERLIPGALATASGKIRHDSVLVAEAVVALSRTAVARPASQEVSSP